MYKIHYFFSTLFKGYCVFVTSEFHPEIPRVNPQLNLYQKLSLIKKFKKCNNPSFLMSFVKT